MSAQGFLEKLLDGASVEWKSLVAISKKISSGGTPKTSVRSYYDGDIPWLRTQEVNFGNIWDTGVKITDEGLRDSSANWIPKNCVIVAMYGATVGKIGINKVPMTTNQACANIQLDPEVADYRYVFHFLRSKYEYIKSLGTGSQTNINAGIVKALEVPIPSPEDPEKSLAIQAEIVRILDSFTELTAELTAELKARKQQYNHYREQLLDHEGEDVEHLPMGDERVGTFTRGGGLQKKDFAESGVGCIHYGQIYTHYGTYAHDTKSFVSEEFAKKARMAKPGDLVIATTSENDEDVCKAVAWLGDEDIAVSSDACFYSHKLNPKFVAYFFQTEQFQKQKRVHITGAKVRRVNADSLAKILIPVPSPEEQERVVNILDKFDTLTTSLSEGLPREIKLRKQQYEYYRDLLLSFPKPEEEA
ncbi:restriction endonuclease subunit S [Falsihalocynthiibacter sp. SS001]|uniref:restriction endonuclease subunit S n=1 Tax=Falsihalocynthiibacter sp. SS001 TaxID=3349698 RepID=UPI0036D2BCBE